MVVVGSHVPASALQLEHLLAHRNVVALELDVRNVLDSRRHDAAVAEAASWATRELTADSTVVLYTSRELVTGDPQESLAIGRTVSQALVDVVRAVSVRPRVLVAKGGITSSDLATKACGVVRAMVLGQVLPGVPVWRCGPESRWEGMPLVVFPGNVGPVEAITTLVDGLRQGLK